MTLNEVVIACKGLYDEFMGANGSWPKPDKHCFVSSCEIQGVIDVPDGNIFCGLPIHFFDGLGGDDIEILPDDENYYEVEDLEDGSRPVFTKPDVDPDKDDGEKS